MSKRISNALIGIVMKHIILAVTSFIVLVVLIASPVYAQVSVTVTTDSPYYLPGNTLEVQGIVSPVTAGQDIAILLHEPSGDREAVDQVTPNADGTYSAIIFVFDADDHLGLWTVKVSYQGALATSSFIFGSPNMKQTFNAGTWNGTTYYVNTFSNSSITSFNFNQSLKQISFDASGPLGTFGFAIVTIPNDLLGRPYSVLIGSSSPTTLSETSNSVQSFIYFTYDHPFQNVKIIGTTVIPEFPSAIIPPLFIIPALIAIILRRKLSPTKGRYDSKKRTF